MAREKLHADRRGDRALLGAGRVPASGLRWPRLAELGARMCPMWSAFLSRARRLAAFRIRVRMREPIAEIAGRADRVRSASSTCSFRDGRRRIVPARGLASPRLGRVLWLEGREHPSRDRGRGRPERRVVAPRAVAAHGSLPTHARRPRARVRGRRRRHHRSGCLFARDCVAHGARGFRRAGGSRRYGASDVCGSARADDRRGDRVSRDPRHAPRARTSAAVRPPNPALSTTAVLIVALRAAAAMPTSQSITDTLAVGGTH